MDHGRHQLTLRIERTDRNRGFMYLGVLAVDERTAGWTRAGWAQPPQKYGASSIGWGICPLNGHLHSTTHPNEWGERRRKLSALGSAAAFMLRRGLAKGWNAWHFRHSEGARKLDGMRRALAYALNRKLGKGFRGWLATWAARRRTGGTRASPTSPNVCAV